MRPLWFVPVVALLACSGSESSPGVTPTPVPNDGALAIRLTPAVLDLHATDTASIQVAVTRRPGFSGPVTISLVDAAEGLETTPLEIAGAEGTLVIRVSETARRGTRFPLVEARSGGSAHREVLTLHIGGLVAEPSRVSVRAVDGPEVRQGHGEVVVDVEGRNFDRVTAFRVGDLAATEIVGRTPTRLSLTVAVPHGAKPGPKDLVLTAAEGDSVTAGALVVTAVTAGPGGDDALNRGTTSNPFRTLTKSLGVAQSGDTVRLLDGTYDAAHGETWPAFAPPLQSLVAAGVRVEGQSRAGTVLAGPGATAPVVGLAFVADGAAAHLTLRDFGVALAVTAGTVELSDVKTSTSAAGLLVGGGVVTVTGADLGAETLGILAVGDAQLMVSSSAIHDVSGEGLRAGDGAPSVTLSGTEIRGTRTGVTAAGTAAVVLDHARVHDNIETGVHGIDDSRVTVLASDLGPNGEAGLWFEGRTLLVRGTTIHDNVQFGVYVAGTPSKVDLGNFLDPGNDDVHGNGPNGTGDQLLDVRTPRSTLGDPDAFTLKSTTLNGSTPAADVYPGNGVWPYLNSPFFSVLGENNVIRVY